MPTPPKEIRPKNHHRSTNKTLWKLGVVGIGGVGPLDSHDIKWIIFTEPPRGSEILMEIRTVKYHGKEKIKVFYNKSNTN